MRIVVLVCGTPMAAVAEHRGEYPRWIREKTGGIGHGPRIAWASRDLRTSAPLPGPRDADAFVLTGSSSSVTEETPWMLRAEELIGHIAAARVPLLGICFGHQLMAKALGGEVRKNPRGREMGTVRVTRIADDPLFAGLPRVFDVQATHVDAVVSPPPGAEVLAETALDPCAAFRVGNRLRAVQFHPEFDADVMRGYVSARAEILRAEGQAPEAILSRVHDGTRGADILRNFVRTAARYRPEAPERTSRAPG